MKWTNPGHQLDILGEKYLKVKHLFLYGTDEKAKKAYDFLCWLGVEQEFDISFVLDITLLNQTGERTFCGRPLIAFQTDLCDFVRSAPETCAVALPWIAQTNERDTLSESGLTNLFYLLQSHNRRDNFIQNFLCVWMMYKHGKLISHWTNFLTTSKCNLNCKYCLNFNEYLSCCQDVSFEDFKDNVDALFSKFDAVFSLHLCGGEPMVVKELPKFIRYLKENYRDRIFEFFIITNGTIVPNEEILSAVKSLHGSFLIDDYCDTVPQSKVAEITLALERHDISYTVNKVDRWFDLDITRTDFSGLSEDALEKHKDNCNSYLQEFGEKRFYACCYQQYAHRAGQANLEETDYIDIVSASKMELLEFRQGYTKKGYTTLCSRCKGIGCEAKYVPAAVQIPNPDQLIPQAVALSEPVETKLVSICVPIYNTGKYLERCIQSLLTQTYQNLEIVLADDGSTDNCPLICDKYAILDPRVVVVRQENQGEASARNLALSIAKGEYVMFIDSDDEYLPHAVELLVNELTRQQADLAMGGYLERRDGVEHFATGHLRKYSVSEFAEHYLHSTCPYDLPYIATTVNAKLFRRDLLVQGGLSFDERFVIGNDAVFICNYLKVAKFVCDVFSPIYIYYKFHALERVQGMGWYYPDTCYLFAYVADRMIALLALPETEKVPLIVKQYQDLLYGLMNAAANKEYLEQGLAPYFAALCQEVPLFQRGAMLDMDGHLIHKEAGALPIRLISFLIVNNRFEELEQLFLALCKTRGVSPYQGQYIRQMVQLSPAEAVSLKCTEQPKEGRKNTNTLLFEQINDLVSTTLAARQLADDWSIRASAAERLSAAAENNATLAVEQARQAEEKAALAEKQARQAEEKAALAEEQAHQAEEKAALAEEQAHQAEEKAALAEEQARQAESAETAYREEYERILQSRSWKVTKPLREITKLFYK